jgi:hypothetical protein
MLISLIGMVIYAYICTADNQKTKNVEITIYNSNGYLIQKIEGPCTMRSEPFCSNRWTIENESTGETYTIRNPGTIITKESNK